MKHEWLIGAVTALFLTGCTTLDARLAEADATDQDRLSVLLSFAEEDISAAYALAVAADDKPAQLCWPALAQYVDRLRNYRTAADGIENPGVAVAYQRARNVRRRLGSGVPEGVEIACAAMVHESRGFLRRLLVRVLRP